MITIDLNRKFLYGNIHIVDLSKRTSGTDGKKSKHKGGRLLSRWKFIDHTGWTFMWVLRPGGMLYVINDLEEDR